MRVPSGKRSTLVTFQRRVGTQSPKTGAWSYVWTDVDPQEWCEVQDVLPSRAETMDDNLAITRRPCRIRCDYRDDVTPDMRVTFDGRVLEITAGPVELGRRDGLEMMCQELSTQGEAP